MAIFSFAIMDDCCSLAKCRCLSGKPFAEPKSDCEIWNYLCGSLLLPSLTVLPKVTTFIDMSQLRPTASQSHRDLQTQLEFV